MIRTDVSSGMRDATTGRGQVPGFSSSGSLPVPRRRSKVSDGRHSWVKVAGNIVKPWGPKA
jgi:hypothetical protein